jgi:uncharacterized membrane protein YbhN (UPF0104 family)
MPRVSRKITWESAVASPEAPGTGVDSLGPLEENAPVCFPDAFLQSAHLAQTGCDLQLQGETAPFPSPREGPLVNKRIIGNVLKYALAFGLMTWVVWKNWKPESPHGLAAVWHKHIDLGEPIYTGNLILAALFCIVGILITFFRWYVLVRAVSLPFRLFDALRLGFVGIFFNTFLPGSVGGDIIKAAFLAREQNRRTVAVATVIMDRAIAVWGLAWFVALLGAVFWACGLLQGPGAEQCHTIVTIAWVIIGSTMLGWVLLGFLPPHRADRFAGRLSRIPKVGHSAAEFWRAVWMYRCRPAVVFGVLVLTWIGQVCFVPFFYFSVLTLWDPASGNEIPSLAQHFLIVPIGLIIQGIPLFPGGAGIGELGFGMLYGWLGCSVESGVLGSLVQRVINWIVGLASGIVYLRMRATLPPLEDQPAELAAVEA